jgi:hypothetical protein
MQTFYALGSLAIIQGIVSLLDGVRHWRYVRACLESPPGTYAPRAAVIVPCKGIDPGFHQNIRALIGQDYPNFIVVFIVESKDDPAYRQIKCVIEQARPTHVHLIEAGRAVDCGQKVHNLRAALDYLETLEAGGKCADGPIEVFAFSDSDARATSQWLRHLISPLGDAEVGATTGYRWYIPEGTVWSLVRSLWNASAVTALGPHKRNFAWGGSMAIKRQTVEEVQLRNSWQGAVSDDYQLSYAVKRSGKYVRFVPHCLLPSRGSCSLDELLEFTTRQMTITRAYSPRVWVMASVSNLLFTIVFLMGLVLISRGVVSHQDATWPGVIVGIMYGLGFAKSVLRNAAVELMLAGHKKEVRRARTGFWFLYPLGSFLFAYNCLASALSRKIRWRGIRYELRSPNETMILSEE